MTPTTQLAQTKEGSIDLETPDSILVTMELKQIINIHTFCSLPVSYQTKLIKLLPSVDQSANENLRVVSSAFQNEFLARAGISWRKRLSDGDFTHESQIKMRTEAERDRCVVHNLYTVLFSSIQYLFLKSRGRDFICGGPSLCLRWSLCVFLK